MIKLSHCQVSHLGQDSHYLDEEHSTLGPLQADLASCPAVLQAGSWRVAGVPGQGGCATRRRLVLEAP